MPACDTPQSICPERRPNVNELALSWSNFAWERCDAAFCCSWTWKRFGKMSTWKITFLTESGSSWRWQRLSFKLVVVSVCVSVRRCYRFIVFILLSLSSLLSLLLSPSGDLGIGLVWDNHPIQHFGTYERWNLVNMRGFQMFEGCFQMFSGCSHMLSQVFRRV